MGHTVKVEGGVTGVDNTDAVLAATRYGSGRYLAGSCPGGNDEVRALADASDLPTLLGIENQLPGSMVTEPYRALTSSEVNTRWAKKAAARLVVIARLCGSSREAIEEPPKNAVRLICAISTILRSTQYILER